MLVAGRAGAPLVTMDLSRAAAATAGSKKNSSFVSETSAAAAPSGAAAITTAPRGLLAVGTSDGRVLLLDPRAGWRPVADVAAHGASVLAADCGRDLLATAGAVVVRGTLAADPVVRVFDVRSSSPRPLSSLHFAPRAIDLKFHPHIYGTLLLASANGVVALADVTSASGGKVFFLFSPSEASEQRVKREEKAQSKSPLRARSLPPRPHIILTPQNKKRDQNKIRPT